jgi:hypothetical protein
MARNCSSLICAGWLRKSQTIFEAAAWLNACLRLDIGHLPCRGGSEQVLLGQAVEHVLEQLFDNLECQGCFIAEVGILGALGRPPRARCGM